ncbi:MAG: AEC family transporter [Gemmatimonadetes bacterium]|nr:AEC family transporter [Gemmatimonadota bacterium]NNM06425.1 AEC family transporter [Gemmatimonadota bacterium]
MSILLNVVGPVFGVMALGALAVRLRVLDDRGVKGLVLFVFNFAIPVLLFRSLAQATLPPDIQWAFLLSYFAGALFVFAAGLGLGRFVFKRTLADQAIFGMGACFSNTVLIGIPILFTAYGPDATLPTLLIIAFHGPLLMSLSAGIIQVGKGGGVTLGGQVKTVSFELLKNPIIVGILLGLLMNLGGWTIPGPVDRVAELLGGAAVPTALFALGASLAAYPITGDVPPALILSGLKLLVHPILVWILAVPVFGLEGIWVPVAVTMAAMPSGINVYLFGARYDAAPGVAARTVFLTNVFSLVTLSTVLYLFQ